MMEKLDRVVVNHDWHTMHPNVDILVDHTIFSDHLPIFIDQGGRKNFQRRGRLFWFKEKWSENTECKKIVKKNWRGKESEHGMWKVVVKKLEKSKGFVEVVAGQCKRKWAGNKAHDKQNEGGAK